jgi:thiamine biosynthesis lipoprotein
MLRRCRPLLGTFVEIAADFELAIDSAFAALERVHRLMSAHERDSDVSRIHRLAHLRPVAVDPSTASVLERALFWAKQSNGAFDVVRAGKIAIERGLLPRYADQPVPEAAHWTWLEIQGSVVSLSKPACIDLGGIAKGFAVDRAIDALRAAGAKCGLVNAGGDLRGFGPHDWPVTVPNPATGQPFATVQLRDGALATSAGLPAERAGLSYAHLPDASTAWVSVTVRASTACDADALTKIIWANGVEALDALRIVGADAFAIRADGTAEQIAQTACAA